MMILLYCVLGLVGLVALLAIIGSFMPKSHTTISQITLDKPRSEVWETISDFEHQDWRTDLKKNERLPDQDGKPVWKESVSDMDLVLRTDVFDAPSRMVRTIADPKLMFQGRWEYELEDEGSGCKLKITEHGEVANPLIRFMSLFYDPSATMREYMTGLAKKFGEEPRIEVLRKK
ncbi:MAG: SRPBCC family protein [Fimbriimonadaceae bacterium]|nr:SRPBCC family protein [Fimbriimonadaceae bacterium]